MQDLDLISKNIIFTIMKKIYIILFCLIVSLCCVSCIVPSEMQVSTLPQDKTEVYAATPKQDIDINLVIRFGEPYYYNGILNYYYYDELYWYPYWYNDYWYFRPYTHRFDLGYYPRWHYGYDDYRFYGHRNFFKRYPHYGKSYRNYPYNTNRIPNYRNYNINNYPHYVSPPANKNTGSRTFGNGSHFGKPNSPRSGATFGGGHFGNGTVRTSPSRSVPSSKSNSGGGHFGRR